MKSWLVARVRLVANTAVEQVGVGAGSKTQAVD